MCHSPLIRNKQLVDRAVQRIREGHLAEANRLLSEAGHQLAPNINSQIIEGKALSTWYHNAVQELASALVSKSKC